MTEEQYRGLVKRDDECLHGIAELKTQTALIVRLLNGNADEDITGVRPRLKMVEERLSTIETNWAAWDRRFRDLRIIGGFLGVTSLAGLIALVRLIWGAP